MNAQAAELTDDLQERGLIAPDVVYHTPSQIGGLESVAGAGLWSPRLQRITMTMVERAEAGGAIPAMCRPIVNLRSKLLSK